MSSTSSLTMTPTCSYNSETDFPYLNAKVEKRADKGRRCGAERRALRRQGGKHYVSITKIVADPQDVLSHKRKARLLKGCADNMAVDVEYSMNRNKRWELEPSDILENVVDDEDVDVAVAEANRTRLPHGIIKISTIHKLDQDGCVKTRSVTGPGSSLNVMLRNDENLPDTDEKNCVGKKAAIVYRIDRKHKNTRVFAGESEKKNPFMEYKPRRRNKMIDMSELETSEMENSVHLDENETYKPSRDFKFSLGDYIKASNNVAVNVRRQSIESIKNIEEIDKDELPKGPRPFDLLDISAATNTENVFERVHLNISDWSEYNFCQQVEDICSDEEILVKWLDPSHLRVSIDLTAKLGISDRPEFMLVLDRTRKAHIGVMLSTTVPAVGPMSDHILKNILTHQKASNVDDIVRILLTLVKEWKVRQNKVEAEKALVPKESLRSTVNSHTLSNAATVVTEFHMADILRFEAGSFDDDPFERISDDEFSSEEDAQGFEMNIVPSSKLRCAICEKSQIEDLFEMDDSWQCISCARQCILTQIRTKNLPVEASFVTDGDSTPYDVLPAILPLPLFNFYTKVAAMEVLSNAEDEINDLTDCPGCNKVVKIQRPNEHSSCCCTGCGTMWCTECKNEPHWPLDCNEFAEWSDKWHKQYPSGLPREYLTRFLKSFACDCGAMVVVPDISEETVRCKSCFKTCDPSMIVAPKVNYSIKSKANASGTEVSPKELAHVSRTAQMIKKEIAEPCARARLERFSKPKVKFVKAVRQYKNIPIGKIHDLRRTVLFIVEYGLAKIYLTKKVPQGLKGSLMQLLRLLEELVQDIENVKPCVDERVKTLESALDKVLEQFKVNDLV